MPVEGMLLCGSGARAAWGPSSRRCHARRCSRDHPFAVAFALTLLDEFRSPRIADVAEVERLTGARVVATIRPRDIPIDRRRRSVDRMVPPILDPTSDDYRLLALHVGVHLPKDGIVAVVAEQPVLAGVVAANLAAIFANEPRETYWPMRS